MNNQNNVPEKEAFDYRSEQEIEIATQIREQNQELVKQQEEQKKLELGSEKGLVLTKVEDKQNRGYISSIVLIAGTVVIVGFITGIVLTLIK